MIYFKIFKIIFVMAVVVFLGVSTLLGINQPQQYSKNSSFAENTGEEKVTMLKVVEENTEKKKEETPTPILVKQPSSTDTGQGVEWITQETVSPTQLTLKEGVVSFSEININTREALVNILCTTRFGGLLKPITGSGIIIDERGVVLTNAHIAQYFLLKDYPTKDSVDCVIRTGSPAKPLYTAKLLHISEPWIKDNANSITSSDPVGTGENDFAFLLINGRTDRTASLPYSFSFIPPDINEIYTKAGNKILIASYPAGFLSSILIQKNLYAVTTITNIKDVFTFGDNMLDLLSLGGSIAAQKGSSGGGVVSGEEKLIGIIVTSSDADSTDDRELRAITLSHIDRSLKKNSGYGVDVLLFGDLNSKAVTFYLATAPSLTKLLTNKLDKQF